MGQVRGGGLGCGGKILKERWDTRLGEAEYLF